MLFRKRRIHNKEPDIRTVEGFTLFYDTYLNYVYSICYRHLSNKNECKDIVSKIFSSVWERRETLYEKYLQQDRDWKDYLARAVKLKVYDYLRKQERIKKYMEVAVNEPVTFINTTEDELFFNELEEQVGMLVNELPPKCKQIFQLSRDKGLANKEIALQLSISDNTVKTHLAKALGYLRTHLKDYAIPKRSTGS